MAWHVQLKNNPSLLFEAQGIHHENLLLALQYFQPSLYSEESCPLQKEKEVEGDQDEEEDPVPELQELIVACQSSLMLNESAKFMTLEGRSWAGAFG